MLYSGQDLYAAERAGNGAVPGPAGSLGFSVWVAVGGGAAPSPPVQAGCRFQPAAASASGEKVRLGSPASGESDPRAAMARRGARIRLLGLLRVRAGHDSPC